MDNQKTQWSSKTVWLGILTMLVAAGSAFNPDLFDPKVAGVVMGALGFLQWIQRALTLGGVLK